MNLNRALLVVALLLTFSGCSGSDGSGDMDAGTGGGTGELDSGTDGGPDELDSGIELPDIIVPTRVGPGEAVILKSKDVTLEVYVNSLSAALDLGVAPLSATELTALPDAQGWSFDGTTRPTLAYAFTPFDETFAFGMDLTIRDIGDANVLLRLDDAADTTWDVVDASFYADGSASAFVSATGIYAFAVKPPCQPCGGAGAGLICGAYYSVTCGREVDLIEECSRSGCTVAGEECQNNVCVVPEP